MVRKFAVVYTAALLLLVAASPARAAVTLGGLTYSVADVHRAATVGPDGAEQHASGEYIVIRLRVSNVGHDPATLSNSDFRLRKGSTMYDSANEVMVDGEFFLSKLNPGVSKTGTLIFDVPANTNPADYELEVFGNGGSDPHYIRL